MAKENKTTTFDANVYFEDRYKVKIKLIKDYLQDRFTDEAKENLKQKITVKGSNTEIPDPASMLYKDDKGIYIPNIQLEASMSCAGKDFKMKSTRKNLYDEVRSLVTVAPDRIYLNKNEPDDILVSHPKRGDGSRVTKGHPLFKKGLEIEFTVINMSEMIEEKNIKDLLIRAGLRYGIGGRHPKWGKFRLISFEKIS